VFEPEITLHYSLCFKKKKKGGGKNKRGWPAKEKGSNFIFRYSRISLNSNLIIGGKRRGGKRKKKKGAK